MGRGVGAGVMTDSIGLLAISICCTDGHLMFAWGAKTMRLKSWGKSFLFVYS